MKKIIIFAFLALIAYSSAFAYGSAGSKSTYEPRSIIDMPSAGVLHKYGYSVDFSAFNNGGLLTEALFAPFKNINIGISYGGSGIIGGNEITFQKIPGFHLKIRLFDERVTTPAIAIGFSTQGRGEYLSKPERFNTYSPGAYLVLSKAFNWELGTILIHTGTNYSIDPDPERRKVNFYGGFEQTLGSRASFVLEYNANSEEYNNTVRTAGGTLNAAVKFALSTNFTAGLQIRDLLDNEKSTGSYPRLFFIEYVGTF